MIAYPVHVPRDGYGGADPRKRKKIAEYNRVAARIEDHINAEVAKLDDDTASSIMSHQVASILREDPNLVQRIIFRMDCGSTGVTICKGSYERAMIQKGRFGS